MSLEDEALACLQALYTFLIFQDPHTKIRERIHYLIHTGLY